MGYVCHIVGASCHITKIPEQDVTVPGQDVTVPGRYVTVPGQDAPSKVSPLECRFLKHHVLVIKMIFYILNITSFNYMFCQKDAEASQISWEFDKFC